MVMRSPLAVPDDPTLKPSVNRALVLPRRDVARKLTHMHCPPSAEAAAAAGAGGAATCS
jgi:hypothetical protein